MALDPVAAFFEDAAPPVPEGPPGPPRKAKRSPTLDPEFDDALDRVLSRMEGEGYKPVIRSTRRTDQEQQRLYRQGRSDPGNIVTELDGITKKSNHQLGRAADVDFPGNSRKALDRMGAIAREEGLGWGGDWTTLVDKYHLELPPAPDAPPVPKSVSAPSSTRPSELSWFDRGIGAASHLIGGGVAALSRATSGLSSLELPSLPHWSEPSSSPTPSRGTRFTPPNLPDSQSIDAAPVLGRGTRYQTPDFSDADPTPASTPTAARGTGFRSPNVDPVEAFFSSQAPDRTPAIGRGTAYQPPQRPSVPSDPTPAIERQPSPVAEQVSTPDPVADFFASQSRRPVAPPERPSVSDELAGTIFTDPVRDFFLHEGLHRPKPRSVTLVDDLVDKTFTAPRALTDYARENARWLTEPTLEDSPLSAGAKGFVAGAGEAGAGMASPFNIATAATPYLKAPGAIGALLRAAEGGGNAFLTGMSAHQTKDALEAGDTRGALAAGGMTLMGALGAGASLHGAPAGIEPDLAPRFENGNHRMPPLGPEHFPAEDVFEPNPRADAGRPPTPDPLADPLGLYPPGLPESDPVAALFAGTEPPRLPARGTGPITPEPTRGSIAAVPPVVGEASRWQQPVGAPVAPPRPDPLADLLASTERPAAQPAPAGRAEPTDAELLAELLANRSRPTPPLRRLSPEVPTTTDAQGRILRPVVPPPPEPPAPQVEPPAPSASTELQPAPVPPVAAEPVAQPPAGVSAAPAPVADDPLWPAVRDAARAQGFEGSDEELLSLFNDRRRSAQELIDDLQAGAEEHSPTALQQFIRQHGGLRSKDNGDLNSVVESFASPSTGNQRGGSSIFRKDGQAIDDMLVALNTDGRWGQLDEHSLVNMLDDISRTAKDAGYEIPSMESALRAAGVDPTRPWWKDFGDAGFDPNQLETAPENPDPLAAALEPAPKAVFAFNQPDFEGGQIPMFHIEGGPFDRSTVTADTLRQMGIPVPEDVLPTGESQPRLPGDVGAVRDAELPQPREDVPFALSREAATTTPVQRDALADLLNGRTVAEPETPTAPIAPEPVPAAVRPNVKDFLVKRLNYTPEEVDAMGPDAAMAIGNKVRMHPEGIQAGMAAHAKPKPEPAGFTEPDPYFESPAVEQDQLEKVLGIQRRMKGAKAPKVPAETVNEPVRGEIPARSLADPVRRGEKLTATERADLGLPPEPVSTSDKSQSEIARAKSKMTADARDRARLLENPTPENLDSYVKLLGEAADRQADREFNGGTGKEDTLRTNERTGEYLASGLGGFEKLYREKPDVFWGMMRASGGALIGALMDPDEPLEGAVRGGILGAALSPTKLFRAIQAKAPSAAKALRDVAKPPSPRDLPMVMKPRGIADISHFELALGQPMRTLPDLWRQIREDLHLAHEAMTEQKPPGVSEETWARTTRAVYLKEAIATVDRYARDADKVGNRRAAIYARGMASSMRGLPTLMETAMAAAGEGLHKVTLGTVPALTTNQARRAIRGVEQAVYTNLLVAALDSGLVNRTQLFMAFPYLGKEGILEGIRASRTPEGQAIAQPVSGETATDAPSQHNPITGLEKRISNAQVRKFVDTMWSPIGVGDVANRKQTYLGGLFIARKFGLSAADAHEWALDVTEATQGVAGELGSNPFHRHLGFARMFTKFPTVAVQLAHAIATHPNPIVRRRGLLLIAGAKAAGALMGIGLLDLMIPRLTLIGPAVKGVYDVAQHIMGTADHGLVDDLDPRRGGTALTGRYPAKLAKEIGHFADEGFGTHHLTDTMGAPKGEHSAWSGFLSLLGLRTSEVDAQRDATDDMFSFVADKTRQRGIDARHAKQDLYRSIESGDTSAQADASGQLSPAQRKAFYQSRQRDTFQRLRARVPKADRAEFDRRFKPAEAR